MNERVEIIPFIRGRITADGKLSEPDIYWILDRWLERHPELVARSKDVRISRARTRIGEVPTELIHVTIVAGEEIRGYDPSTDRDLYEYYLVDLGEPPLE